MPADTAGMANKLEYNNRAAKYFAMAFERCAPEESPTMSRSLLIEHSDVRRTDMSEGGFAQPSSGNIPSFQIADASAVQIYGMLKAHDIEAAVCHDWRSLQAHTIELLPVRLSRRGYVLYISHGPPPGCALLVAPLNVLLYYPPTHVVYM